MPEVEYELLSSAQREQAKRDIIDSAQDDVPPPGGKAQLLAALNLTAAGEKTPPEAPRSGPFSGGAAYVVGLALVVAAGGAFFASSSVQSPHAGPEPSISTSSAGVILPSDEPASHRVLVDPPVPVAPPEEEAVAPSQLPVAESAPAPPQRARSSVRSARSAPDSETRSASTLGREVARMTAARSALSAGDAARALELLDSYESEFPAGAFSVEVSVLRVEALARSGRMEEARRVGERFLREHPHGLPASRVAATLGIASDPEPAPTPAPTR